MNARSKVLFAITCGIIAYIVWLLAFDDKTPYVELHRLFNRRHCDSVWCLGVLVFNVVWCSVAASCQQLLEISRLVLG